MGKAYSFIIRVMATQKLRSELLHAYAKAPNLRPGRAQTDTGTRHTTRLADDECAKGSEPNGLRPPCGRAHPSPLPPCLPAALPPSISHAFAHVYIYFLLYLYIPSLYMYTRI